MRVCNQLSSFAVVLLAGCIGTIDGGLPDPPTLLAASKTKLAIGEDIEFYGAAFLHGKEGRTDLVLKGTFTETGGAVHDVNLRLKPHWADGNRIVVSQLGPFSNPFTATGGGVGVFSGTATAVNEGSNKTEAFSEPIPLTLDIKPSIVIRRFEPMTAMCDVPARRILGGFDYKIEVEAIGFTPVNFTYVVVGEPGVAFPRLHRQVADNGVIGTFEDLVFAPVGNDEHFYLAQVGVSALGTDGKEYANLLVFGVHRPIEYMDSGEVALAEIEPAKPTSGCIAGGDNGRTVTYTETETETRTRTIGQTWDETWLSSRSGTVGGSTTETNGVSMTATQSMTQGYTFGWSSETGVSGEATFFGLAKLGLSQKIGFNGSQSTSYTQGWSVGRDYSVSDTESWAFTTTRSHSISEGGSDFYSVSSSTSISTAYTAQILPGEFGVFYRQTSRLALPGTVVSYNLCGEPTYVAETNFFDYTWAVDLGQGPTCPAFPEPNLPEAECFISPCTGG